jgi:hypothetical protein
VAPTDDFTIVIDQPWNTECGIEVFEELPQLWRLVDRYRMKPPLTINVIDNQSIGIWTLTALHDQSGKWRLTDETPPGAAHADQPIAFPLIINSKDSRGNILKVRIQLATGTTPHNAEQSSNQSFFPG